MSSVSDANPNVSSELLLDESPVSNEFHYSFQQMKKKNWGRSTSSHFNWLQSITSDVKRNDWNHVVQLRQTVILTGAFG